MAAFIIPDTASIEDCKPFTTTIALTRKDEQDTISSKGKAKTQTPRLSVSGQLTLCGIFEPLQAAAPEHNNNTTKSNLQHILAIQKACRAQGGALRNAPHAALQAFALEQQSTLMGGGAGRLDIHVLHAKNVPDLAPQDTYRCQLCLSSGLENRIVVDSQHVARRSGQHEKQDDIACTWDKQLTLYTPCAKSDVLHLELFQGYSRRSLLLLLLIIDKSRYINISIYGSRFYDNHARSCCSVFRASTSAWGHVKIPLSTYGQAPRKTFHEYHDILVIVRDNIDGDQKKKKPHATKPSSRCDAATPTLCLDLCFFNDQNVQTFVHGTAASNTRGTLWLKLDSFDMMNPPWLETTTTTTTTAAAAKIPKKKTITRMQVSVRCTLLLPSKHHDDEAVLFPYVSIDSDVTLHHITWESPENILSLSVPSNYMRDMATAGLCPSVRLEVMRHGSSNVFGHDEALTRNELAIQSLLCQPHVVMTKRVAVSMKDKDDDDAPAIHGTLRFHLVYDPGRVLPYAVACVDMW